LEEAHKLAIFHRHAERVDVSVIWHRIMEDGASARLNETIEQAQGSILIALADLGPRKLLEPNHLYGSKIERANLRHY
jgi:hypothetical protein